MNSKINNTVNIKNKNYIIDPTKEKIKYCKLLDFFEVLPYLRKDISTVFNNFDFSKTHIIYLILAIIDLCNFRIGNEKYKKSTGIATLKTNNIQDCSNVNSKCSYLSFNGKRQVFNECFILNEKVSKILMNLTEFKNDDDFVFTYVNNNIEHKITADDVNELLKNYGNISTKMFRTWKANFYFLKHLMILDLPNNQSEIKRNISESVKKAAEKLHHSKNICRRSYLDTRLINLYKENPNFYLEYLDDISDDFKNNFILKEEILLYKIMSSLCY